MSQQQPQPLPSPYAFMAYPAGAAAVGTAEYAFSPGGNPYPPPAEHAPSSSAGSIPPPPPPPPYLHYAAYAHHHAHHHMGHHGHHPPLPPSPIITGAHLPPSPVMHHSQHQPQHPHPHPHPHQYPNQQSTTPPTSPDRNAESKAMRQLCTAIAKMQSTMKDLAERQEQILDRMSVLEQRSTSPPTASFRCRRAGADPGDSWPGGRRHRTHPGKHRDCHGGQQVDPQPC